MSRLRLRPKRLSSWTAVASAARHRFCPGVKRPPKAASQPPPCQDASRISAGFPIVHCKMVLRRQHKRSLVFAVLIQRRPIHSVFVSQNRQIEICCPAARGRRRAAENFQIAGNKMRLHFPVPERQQFPRFRHRRAKSRLGRDAEKTRFSDQADGKGLSFLPTDDTLVMFVIGHSQASKADTSSR